MNELIKAGDLSRQYGVSTRTLRYYEEMGLLQSQRTDEYAYRMYDEQALNRLEQILILRKLNISIKDIQYIFSTDSSKAVLDVLSKKAQNIDDDISLLYELKQIVLSFIRQIEKSDFNKQEDVNQLYQKASEIEKALTNSGYEGNSAQTLDLDSIAMRTRRMLNVRVVELPTRPIAIYYSYIDLPNGNYDKLPEDLKQFNDIFYPAKFSRFNGPIRDFEDFVVLPENYPADPSFIISEFTGGLYAVGLMQGDGKYGMMADISSLYKWIGENGFIYREDVEMFRNDLPSQGNYPPVSEMYFPVVRNDEQKPAAILKNADAVLSKIKIKQTHKIDLGTLVQEGTTVSNMKDGELIIYEHSHDGRMSTEDKYSFPIMVKLNARTDSTNLRLGYAKAGFAFNWELSVSNPSGDDINGEVFHVPGLYLPARYFADIVWILDRNYMAIIVNGDVKYYKTDMNTDGTNGLSDYVDIAAAWGSTVTVNELEIFELE